jgi:hypothetical protein
MAVQEHADEHAQEVTDTTHKLKRRGPIAGAAALVVGLAARSSQPVDAAQLVGTNNYTGSLDANADGVQGYASSASNAGVFGRNNDSNGIGVFGVGTNGIGTLYCVESPESWFEDFGEAALVAGTAAVALDLDFAAVVDTTKLYVFLTPYVAGNGLAVTARTATGFTVTEMGGGKSGSGFAYRVVAKRKDVPSPRLAKVTLPNLTAAPAPPPPPTTLPAAIPTPKAPLVPHHAEEDVAPAPAPAAATGSAQAVASSDSEFALLPMTRL